MRQALKAALVVIGLLLLALTALAQSGSESSASPGTGYDLSWWTVDGGGTTFTTPSGTGYTLGGTVGQPDAGLLTGGEEPNSPGTGYTLGGGFWGGGALAIEHDVYLPLVVRGYP